MRTRCAAFTTAFLFHSGCGEKIDPVGVLSESPPVATTSAPCWERDIQPLMVQRCFVCHGADRPFDFSSLALARLSLEPMRTKIRSEQMPPDGPLDSVRKSMFLKWIESDGPSCAP